MKATKLVMAASLIALAGVLAMPSVAAGDDYVDVLIGTEDPQHCGALDSPPSNALDGAVCFVTDDTKECTIFWVASDDQLNRADGCIPE